jgi:hypothetical protein
MEKRLGACPRRNGSHVLPFLSSKWAARGENCGGKCSSSHMDTVGVPLVGRGSLSTPDIYVCSRSEALGVTPVRAVIIRSNLSNILFVIATITNFIPPALNSISSLPSFILSIDMALEIGTISGVLGIASFGIQIADSVVKLKSFLDAFREAPQDIKDLLDETERYGGLLSRVCIASSQDEKFNVSSAYVQDCLGRCVREANALQLLAWELDAEISKRSTIGTFKYLMKKEKIEKMRNRLERASAMFKFAYKIRSEYYSPSFTVQQANAVDE